MPIGATESTTDILLMRRGVDYSTRSYLCRNRRWWTYDQAVMIARNPLIFNYKNDKNWRPGLTRALKKSGVIKKCVDGKALSVYYLYVSVFLAHRTWLGGTCPILDTELEKELYEQLTTKGISEKDFDLVFSAIARLPEKNAHIILYRYGFLTNGKIYRSYDGLKKKLPKEYNYTSAHLKNLEEEGLKRLKETLPPLFKRIAEKEKLWNEWLRVRYNSPEKAEQISEKLLDEYGIKTY